MGVNSSNKMPHSRRKRRRQALVLLEVAHPVALTFLLSTATAVFYSFTKETKATVPEDMTLNRVKGTRMENMTVKWNSSCLKSSMNQLKNMIQRTSLVRMKWRSMIQNKMMKSLFKKKLMVRNKGILKMIIHLSKLKSLRKNIMLKLRNRKSKR
jgi:hypothetical protein